MITVHLTFDTLEKAVKALQVLEPILQHPSKSDQASIVSSAPLPQIEVHTKARKKSEPEAKAEASAPVQTRSETVKSPSKIEEEEKTYTTHDDLRKFVQTELLPVYSQLQIMHYVKQEWGITRLTDLPEKDIPEFCSRAKAYAYPIIEAKTPVVSPATPSAE